MFLEHSDAIHNSYNLVHQEGEDDPIISELLKNDMQIKKSRLKIPGSNCTKINIQSFAIA